jgi:hypothetical protein
MDRATSVSFIPTILLALVLIILCVGNKDFLLSKTLYNRIEILESKGNNFILSTVMSSFQYILFDNQ